jgi:hypothetical protein
MEEQFREEQSRVRLDERPDVMVPGNLPTTLPATEEWVIPAGLILRLGTVCLPCLRLPPEVGLPIERLVIWNVMLPGGDCGPLPACHPCSSWWSLWFAPQSTTSSLASARLRPVRSRTDLIASILLPDSTNFCSRDVSVYGSFAG